jgi:hypothetical protein
VKQASQPPGVPGAPGGPAQAKLPVTKQPQQSKQPTKPKSQPPSGAKKTLADAQLRPFETVMELDTIATAIDSARDDFISAATPALDDLIPTLVRTLDREHPPQTPVELVHALQDELQGLHELGQQTVIAELAAQAPPVTLANFHPTERRNPHGEWATGDIMDFLKNAVDQAGERKRSRTGEPKGGGGSQTRLEYLKAEHADLVRKARGAKSVKAQKRYAATIAGLWASIEAEEKKQNG